MKAHRRRRLYFILVIVAGVATAVSLAIYALGQNINLYFTPTQIVQGQAPHNHTFRLGGMVEQGSIKHIPNSLAIDFLVTDYQHHIAVYYSGILPALFRDGQGVVVQGQLNGQGQFIADQVLAKHDEKYMPPGITMKNNKAS